MLIAHEQNREVYQTKHNSRAILITMINLFLIIVKMYTRYILMVCFQFKNWGRGVQEEGGRGAPGEGKRKEETLMLPHDHIQPKCHVTNYA